MATKGGKQPYAIAMRDGSPFGIAAMARIHDRMPAILRPEDYDRWLGMEPDPRDLLAPFPAEPMTMWPISKRVNSPQNDDESLLEEVRLPAA